MIIIIDVIVSILLKDGRAACQFLDFAVPIILYDIVLHYVKVMVCYVVYYYIVVCRVIVSVCYVMLRYLVV